VPEVEKLTEKQSLSRDCEGIGYDRPDMATMLVLLSFTRRSLLANLGPAKMLFDPPRIALLTVFTVDSDTFGPLYSLIFCSDAARRRGRKREAKPFF